MSIVHQQRHPGTVKSFTIVDGWGDRVLDFSILNSMPDRVIRWELHKNQDVLYFSEKDIENIIESLTDMLAEARSNV